MHRISAAQRHARIAVRHHLAPAHRVVDPVEAARGVVCLHATDPATVYMSAWARIGEPSLEAVERALYEDRLLVRMLAMRRTMFVVAVEEAPVLQAAAALDVARTERRRNEQLVVTLGEADPAAWLRVVEAATIEALDEFGEATAAELSTAVPALARKVRVNLGKAYEGDIGISSRVLILLALEGRIVRGRARGTWISSQYRWASMERWLGAPLEPLDPVTARARLIERWLERFGPGTEADIRWWTGLTARAVRAALTAVGAEPVDLDGTVGYVLPGDVGRPRSRNPGWPCCPPSTPPRWDGRPATGTWAATRHDSSTGTATQARPSGWMAASWAAGPSATAGRSSRDSWRTSAVRPSWPSPRRQLAWAPSSLASASCPASPRRTTAR